MKLDIIELAAAVAEMEDCPALMIDAAELHYARTGIILNGFVPADGNGDEELIDGLYLPRVLEHGFERKPPVTYNPRRNMNKGGLRGEYRRLSNGKVMG